MRNPQIDDAFAQISQARTASPATALADVWTAAEVLFSGTLDDPNYAVADVLANLAQFLFVRDFVTYLGDRVIAAGYSPGLEQAQRGWMTEVEADELDNQSPLRLTLLAMNVLIFG